MNRDIYTACGSYLKTETYTVCEAIKKQRHIPCVKLFKNRAIFRVWSYLKTKTYSMCEAI